METSGRPDHEQGQVDRFRTEADTAPRNEEVSAWEELGDDLWLPRRVRGSFVGGALG
jgi:hypothetical protein